MDMGIVNAGQLAIYDDLPEELRECVEDVVQNRRADSTERPCSTSPINTKAMVPLQKRKKTSNGVNYPVEKRLEHALRQRHRCFCRRRHLRLPAKISNDLFRLSKAPLMDGNERGW